MTDEHVFPVPDTVAKSALIDKQKYDAWYKKSVEDPEGFWSEQAERLDWIKPFTKVKDVELPGSRCAHSLVLRRHAERLAKLPRSAPCGARRSDGNPVRGR